MIDVLLLDFEFFSLLSQLVEMLLLVGFVETLLCDRWSRRLNMLVLVVNVHFEQPTALASYQIF